MHIRCIHSGSEYYVWRGEKSGLYIFFYYSVSSLSHSCPFKLKKMQSPHLLQPTQIKSQMLSDIQGRSLKLQYLQGRSHNQGHEQEKWVRCGKTEKDGYSDTYSIILAAVLGLRFGHHSLGEKGLLWKSLPLCLIYT